MSVIDKIRFPEPLLRESDWHPGKGYVELTTEKVIGLNNLLTIAWLGRGLELSTCVVRIITPYGMGTGAMIGPDLVLTNNHVIENAAMADETYIEFNYQRAWDNRQTVSRRFKLNTDGGRRFRTNADLDYTICAVEGAPGSLYGFVDLSSARTPQVNDYVTIIQHPKGEYKQIALTDNKVSGVFSSLVQYTTDTERGSSGSPVFDQNWQLVALHHAGGDMTGPNGSTVYINEGINIMHVLADAREFLGLPDKIEGLIFGAMQNDIVTFLGEHDPLRKVKDYATRLLTRFPDFEDAINETQLRMPLAQVADRSSQEFIPLAAAIFGVAAGAGVSHLAHVTTKEHRLESFTGVQVPFDTAPLVPIIRAAIASAESSQPREIFGLISGIATVVGAVDTIAGVFETQTQQNEFLGTVLAIVGAVQAIGDIVEGTNGNGEFLSIVKDVVDIVDTVSDLFEGQSSQEILPAAAAAFLAGVYAGAKAYSDGK